MIDAIPTDVAQLPPYLIDDSVRLGIVSVLAQDQAKEEIFRLQAEHRHMIKWLDVRLQNLKTTIMQCHGMFMFPQEYKCQSDRFRFQDEHLLFFLQNSLTDTIKVGTNWMVHTSPWADIMGNPQWPADIKNSSGKHHQATIIEEEDISDDDGISEPESEVDVESDIELEEDEVDQLVNMME